MIDCQKSRVRSLLQFILVGLICRSVAGQISLPFVVLEDETKDLLVSNQRETIADCHFRNVRYTFQDSYQTPKVAQGKQAYLREFPHMAAIGWSYGNSTTMWNCGGSLIWENYVLTAAHCAADADNMAPNVARFGDLNLYDARDDAYAQQRTIVLVVRHPSHKFIMKYHDIALMRLDRSVIFHDTVVPACLWNQHEISFTSMEAAGWGDTGFYEQRSPVLLKVSLSSVDPERCSNHFLHTRGLRQGLHENQMCAGDIKMDTCPGDSGGPLEVKLLHNTRVTPFLVGVTSFGAACGRSVPGVYTRVAPYIPWIRSVLSLGGEDIKEWMFSPQGCAIKYARWREYEPAVAPRSDSSFRMVYLNKAQIFLAETAQQVSIHWNQTVSVEPRQCYGVIIDDRWIVTLARCTSVDGQPPSHIRYRDNRTNTVMEYYTHPEYKKTSPFNDIGLLMLKDPLKFTESFFPVCLWHNKELPLAKMAVAAQGPYNLIVEQIDSINFSSSNMVNALAIGYTRDIVNCTSSGVEKKLTEEHLCFGSEIFLVPGTCTQTLGGPIYSEVRRLDRRFTYVYALNLFGKDCGFGQPAVGVKISHHTEWLESILLPKAIEDDAEEPVIFLNSPLATGDSCKSGSGNDDGVCVEASFCPRVVHDFHRNEQVRFCQTGSLVCCPRDLIRNETDAAWREIDECENRQSPFEDSLSFSNNLIPLVWNMESSRTTCMGTIITKRAIMIAANCVGIGKEPPTEISNQESAFKSMTVERVITHPEFDLSTKQNNIALIKTKDDITTLWGKRPACLWTNNTHTPFYLTQVLLNTTFVNITEAYTMYSANCAGVFGRTLQPNELCVFVREFSGILSVDEDAPALWRTKVGKQYSVPYVVAIASQKSPDGSSDFIHTRVSSYLSWIKSVL